MSNDDEKPLDPQAAAFMAKVKRLMMIASVTTFLAVAAVLAVVGYRVYHWQGSAPQAEGEAVPHLPAGAKVLSTAVGDGRVVLTVENAGAIELFSFDAASLKPLGRVRLAPAPEVPRR
jgi:hypothetical protein